LKEQVRELERVQKELKQIFKDMQKPQ